MQQIRTPIAEIQIFYGILFIGALCRSCPKNNENLLTVERIGDPDRVVVREQWRTQVVELVVLSFCGTVHGNLRVQILLYPGDPASVRPCLSVKMKADRL